MIQQFHAGQDVEVTDSRYPLSTFSWRKAKIANSFECEECGTLWKVQFPDGTRAVVDAAHIRAGVAMTHFHEGQEVEVRLKHDCEVEPVVYEWRKANIVSHAGWSIGCRWREDSERWQVQFPDGTRAVFDAAHIRAVRPAHNDHFTSDYECADGNSE